MNIYWAATACAQNASPNIGSFKIEQKNGNDNLMANTDI